jgi:hypothetical protein
MKRCGICPPRLQSREEGSQGVGEVRRRHVQARQRIGNVDIAPSAEPETRVMGSTCISPDSTRSGTTLAWRSEVLPAPDWA